jgi:prepilin-type N-terminal cleavage/methylation domain-containing protein
MPITIATRRRAFTLLELLVVVAIIGIIAAIVYPNISGSRGKARDAQRISDLGQLQFALQLYYDRCGQYPNSLGTGTSVGCPTGVTLDSFIAQIPTVPQTGAGYDYTLYQISTVNVGYVLHTTLESTNAAVAKGLNGVPPVSGGAWSPTDPTTWSCSNGSTSTSYCVTSN